MVRIVLGGTGIIFFGGNAIQLDVPVEVFVVPAIVGLSAQLICWPRERRVAYLGPLIVILAVFSMVAGLPGTTEGDVIMTSIFAVGTLTLLLVIASSVRDRSSRPD